VHECLYPTAKGQFPRVAEVAFSHEFVANELFFF
jgi:hypothetical protein